MTKSGYLVVLFTLVTRQFYITIYRFHLPKFKNYFIFVFKIFNFGLHRNLKITNVIFLYMVVRLMAIMRGFKCHLGPYFSGR